MNDIHHKFGLRKIVNAAGPVSVFGGGVPVEEAAAAAAAVLSLPVEIAELQRLAGERIAATFGAEWGCVTAGSAAGIAIAVAAAMTGADRARIAQLPDTSGMKSRVVMQRGHDADFGALVSQMIRLTGAEAVLVGTKSRCDPDDLRCAIGTQTAAAVYVVSHHTAQDGMLPLADFCAICRSQDVPVIVDAAGEHNLGDEISAGADLAVASAHKNYGAMTAGILAGRRDLVEACLLQDCGIGRPMKVGKEGIASVIAALDVWRRADRASLHAEWMRRAVLAADALAAIPGLRTEIAPDLPDSPLHRTRVHMNGAVQMVDALAQRDPSIRVWRLGLSKGYFELDPRTVSDTEMADICHAIRAIAASRDDLPGQR